MLKLFHLLLIWSCVTLTAAATSPSEAVDRFLKDCGIRRGSVALKIVDLSDGSVVASHNVKSPLIPASIMKSVTTAALLNETGIDYRYRTPVWLDGEVSGEVLNGNLIVEAQGDPSINSGVEPVTSDLTEEIAHALEVIGIRRIGGKVLIDESALSGSPRPVSWMPADFKEAYGTGSHAFNFENNSVGSRSVENPKAVFQKRLEEKFRAKGIVIDGGDVRGGEKMELLVHESAPIDEIMRSCMMRSDNLFAESMLRTYGRLIGEDGSTERAARREFDMWKKEGMPLEGVVIIDGSGLSRSNRVTADFMTGVLSTMWKNADYASFFPLAGQEGTLKKFLSETPLDSYIAMKTGSMKGIQCYAGYKVDDEYVPTHSVVIIMNEILGSRERAIKATQQMLLDIFSETGVESTSDENEN